MRAKHVVRTDGILKFWRLSKGGMRGGVRKLGREP